MPFTNLGEKFAANCLTKFFGKAVCPEITNQDWEGDIKGGGADRLNIITYADINIGTYTIGSDMTLQDPTDREEQLIVDQKKYYYFRIDDLDRFYSYVKNIDSSLIENASSKLAEVIDTFVLRYIATIGSESPLGLVKAGHRVGTDYVLTGNADVAKVTITGSTGAVVGVGTAFTAAMLGKGFRADTSTVWYRIVAYASATSITIKNWDDTLPLTDGDHGGTGVGCRVEADTKIQATKANIYGFIVDLARMLDEDNVPKDNRYLVVPPRVAALLKQATELIPAVPTAYAGIVENGLLGTIGGFKVYESNYMAGNNTVGFWILAGHKAFITFAMAFTESGTEDVPKQFAKAYKGLNVYGVKVLIERRKCGAALFCFV